MTPREVVQRTLDFKGPERIAMALPDPYPHDIVGLHPAGDPNGPGEPWHEVGGGRWEMTDGWGNLWARIDATTKGEVARGVLQSWDDLETVRLPDYSNPQQFEGVRQHCAQDTTHYRIGGIPGFCFSIARKMRQLENYLADLVLERENVERLHERIEAVLIQMIDQHGKVGIDGIMFGEDWGCQDRLLISPDMWREVFKPSFKRLCDRIHSHGMHVLMHSCGYIWDIIEDLIEVGVDALQMDQPELFGIEELDEAFGGRMTFFSPVDIQKTLQTRDPAKIETSARKMVELLGGHGGGLICGYYGGNEAIGLPPEVQDIACQAFVKYGSQPPQNRPPSIPKKTS